MLAVIVAEDVRGRVYLPATPDDEAIAQKAEPEWRPEIAISGSTQYLGVQPYGMVQFSHLFTSRQPVVLTTLTDLVCESRERVKRDAIAAGMADDGKGLQEGCAAAAAYAEAVAVYLAFASIV
jgi:putative DNA methylase